jgi:hypothetical protein
MKSFSGFTKQQKQQLLTAWKRPAAKEKAARFVDRVECFLRLECMGMEVDPAHYRYRSHMDFRGDCRMLAKHAEALINIFRRMPVSERAAIATNLSGWCQYQEPNPGMTSTSRASLQEMCKPENAGDIHEIFSHLLYGVVVQAKAMDTPQQPGPGKPLERALLEEMINVYRHEFGKKPAASPNGVFMAFLKNLDPIIGLVFGEEMVKTALSQDPHDGETVITVPFDTPLDASVEAFVEGKLMIYIRREVSDGG